MVNKKFLLEAIREARQDFKSSFKDFRASPRLLGDAVHFLIETLFRAFSVAMLLCIATISFLKNRERFLEEQPQEKPAAKN